MAGEVNSFLLFFLSGRGRRHLNIMVEVGGEDLGLTRNMGGREFFVTGSQYGTGNSNIFLT